jgi:hypothetical protein
VAPAKPVDHADDQYDLGVPLLMGICMILSLVRVLYPLPPPPLKSGENTNPRILCILGSTLFTLTSSVTTSSKPNLGL